MNEKLARALSFVDEKYVHQAAKRRRIRKRTVVTLIAAILAIAIFWQTPSIPLTVNAKAVSLPKEFSEEDRYTDYESWEIKRQVMSVTAAAMTEFTADCSAQVLSDAGDENRLWSPVNAYIGLGMAAELTEGAIQEKILKVLCSRDMTDLRSISMVWEKIYQNNGNEISVLANSLWLDHEISYDQEIMDRISSHYYAPVYQGDLGSNRIDRDIANWLHNQTGGFLKNRTGGISLDDECMLALASTIYFQGRWIERFDADLNTKELFHAPSKDVECTFMNAKEKHMEYYWEEDYGAVYQGLQNNTGMWFILPDEDKTVEDVLEAGEYVKMLTRNGFDTENSKRMKVNLSIPKFDFSSTVDLKSALQSIGLSELFDPAANAFSPAVESNLPVWLDSVQQDSRIAIDEEGVTAASYILLQGAMEAEPPEEIIDFVVDRPFIFAITVDGVPMFVGVVHMP